MATTQPGIAELKVNGAIYGGWKTLRAQRSIEQVAGAFDLGISEQWPGQSDVSPILPGRACQLLLDGEAVITGHVDDAMPDFDDTRHEVRVQGRDKTADLVDCSAIWRSGQWSNVKLDQLARDLVKPYGIKVIVEADVGAAFSSWAIEEGETVFATLERAARQRAVLLTSNAYGDLVITRAGKTRCSTALVEGVNIKAARGNFSWRDRYSSYGVKGQGRLGADGDAVHAAPAATVNDDAITRYRPLVVIAESHNEHASARDRAEWERNVRRGRSARASITVRGWRNDAGELWAPNQLISVTSPKLYLPKPSDLLIVGCVYTLDDRQGSLTELAVALAEAFRLLEGVGQSKLFGRMRSKEERQRREQSHGWGAL